MDAGDSTYAQFSCTTSDPWSCNVNAKDTKFTKSNFFEKASNYVIVNLKFIEINIRRKSFSSKLKMEMFILFVKKRTAGKSRNKDNAD